MANNVLTNLTNGSSGSLVKGVVVRASTTAKSVTTAIATSSAGIQGTIGVVDSGVVAPGGPTSIALYGVAFTLLETGLTPVNGQTLYVSATTAGRATNAAPASNVMPIGIIIDSSIYALTGGVIGDIGPALVAVSTSGGGSSATADWPVANTRWFAVDAAGGSDSNVGFSDVSSADAWTKRKQTVAGLAAILPKLGAARTAGIMFGGGGQTYADDIAILLSGTSGYVAIACRGTATLASAGAVAGAGDVNDLIGAGFVTAAGMNASGYNPTGSPTTTQVQCLQFGGAAPGFAAEPAVPCGARIRFDVNTATAALRNVARTAIRVSGGDTLYPSTAFPAVPTAADVFYIESPGVTVLVGPIWHGNNALRLIGFAASAAGNAGFSGQTLVNAFVLTACTFAGGITARPCNLAMNASATFPGIAVTVVGETRVAGAFTARGADIQFNAAVIVGLATMQSMVGFSMSQAFFAGGMQIEGGATGIGDINATANTTLGSLTAGAPTRFLRSANTAIILLGGRAQIGQLVFVAGSAVGMSVRGPSVIDNMAITTAVNGFMQNEGAALSDVGLAFDFANNTGNGAIFKQGAANASNAAGTNGAIRMVGGASGHILTWAQINASGIVDRAGNRIISVEEASWGLKFSGFLLGGAGATTSYMADTGPVAAGANLIACEYPTSLRIIDRLRFKPETNTFATAVTATLFKNGVATALTVSIPAGTTAVVSDTNTAHAVLFADGDLLAVVLANAGDAAKTLTGMAWIEGPS